jgi:hypothetical protein
VGFLDVHSVACAKKPCKISSDAPPGDWTFPTSGSTDPGGARYSAHCGRILTPKADSVVMVAIDSWGCQPSVTWEDIYSGYDRGELVHLSPRRPVSAMNSKTTYCIMLVFGPAAYAGANSPPTTWCGVNDKSNPSKQVKHTVKTWRAAVL